MQRKAKIETIERDKYIVELPKKAKNVGLFDLRIINLYVKKKVKDFPKTAVF